MMHNGELRHGIPPNPVLEEHYKALFVKWLQSGRWYNKRKKVTK